MPRRTATEAAQEITPAQAHYILGKLLEDKRLSVSELSGYLRSMQQEIRELEQRLSALKTSYQPAQSRATGSARTVSRSNAPEQDKGRRSRKPRRPATEEQRASQQLQGQYMSLIRRFPAERREAFKAISNESGRQAAIDRMRAELPA